MTESVPLIPREVLFGNPVKENPQISPDGKRIAYLAPVNNVLNVWVKTVDVDDDQPVTNDTVRGIRWYFWAGDNAEGIRQHILYLQDVGGDENWRLYAANLASRETRDLTPFKDVQVQPVYRDKHFPDELLIAMNKENPQAHDVYRLNVQTGEMRLVAKNPGNVFNWVSDAHFSVRGAVTGDAEGGAELLVREDENGEWRSLVKWSQDDALISGLVGFSKSGDAIFLRDSRNANSARLVRWNIRADSADVIAQDPHYDVAEVVTHPDTYEVQMVSFVKARQDWVIVDPSIQDDIAAIRQLHHGDFFLVSRDDADQTWIVGFVADDGPVSFYAFDRETRAGTFLFSNQPELAQYKLAPIEPISFTARDGWTLHGYITFPAGAIGRDRKNLPLPLVLDVHGGPWGRDVWGYNPEAQWFANRGYVCLQVNFRGSTGYGKTFVNAGDREWGAKMHDDLVDAVNWAVQQGYADPRKIAIFGGSYGGYAALVGATFTPDLFCCAVDIVGPSNLVTLLKSIPPYWTPMKNMMYRRVGDPDTEPEFLESRSPLFKADRIKIPMLIAQGANDPRVKQAESEQIVEAMKKNGVNYEYLLFPDEGHGFARPENRLKFCAVAERFLAQHLGGRAEP